MRSSDHPQHGGADERPANDPGKSMSREQAELLMTIAADFNTAVEKLAPQRAEEFKRGQQEVAGKLERAQRSEDLLRMRVR